MAYNYTNFIQHHVQQLIKCYIRHNECMYFICTIKVATITQNESVVNLYDLFKDAQNRAFNI